MIVPISGARSTTPNRSMSAATAAPGSTPTTNPPTAPNRIVKPRNNAAPMTAVGPSASIASIPATAPNTRPTAPPPTTAAAADDSQTGPEWGPDTCADLLCVLMSRTIDPASCTPKGAFPLSQPGAPVAAPTNA